MRKSSIIIGLALLVTVSAARAQVTNDVLGMHNLGPGTTSPISAMRGDSCYYCHAPHSAGNIGLWNQTLSKQTYTTYTSTTETNKGQQPRLGYSSSQCLSCHDGTVAIADLVVTGQLTTTGHMKPADILGANMQSSHPFSLNLPLQDNIDLAASLTGASHTTLDTTHAIRLVHGNVECNSCHTPHVQARDVISQNFLQKPSTNGAMCLACHDPTRTSTTQTNPLLDWTTSAHAIATNGVSSNAMTGTYSTVAANACISCHAPHNAAPGSRNLRGQNEQDCIACHNGGTNIASLPAYANVFSEYATGKIGHPIPAGTNTHDAAEPEILNNNRHATCVDCHNSHSSQKVGTFPAAPAIRLSQKDLPGVSAADGTTLLPLATNQYETCLRCHGTSAGKVSNVLYGYAPYRQVADADPLNLVPQFLATATSSHPVTHVSNSTWSQPSLLPAMLNVDNTTSARTMGVNGLNTQILCTDCHNSDDNREFGGSAASGPNGPHGSKWLHILERQYLYNTPPTTAGGLVGGLNQAPDVTSVNSPYALCGKCHNMGTTTGGLTATDGSGSWAPHAAHINDGFSCATCHTAHGMGAVNTNVTGERLVNFDLNIVGNNGTNPISYTRIPGSPGTCVLQCHGVNHDASTSAVFVGPRKGTGKVK